MLLLTGNEVMKVLDMSDCMEVVEKAFAELASGTAVMPLRISIYPLDGLALYMPAYLKEMGALACKVVISYKNNPVKHNLPTLLIWVPSLTLVPSNIGVGDDVAVQMMSASSRI